MEPKQKRYWLRGGIIYVFLCSVLLFLAIIGFGEHLYGDVYEQSSVLQTSLNILSYPAALVWDQINSWTNHEFTNGFGYEKWKILFGAFLFLGDWFLTGSLLGWFYGKIKNRKLPVNI